MVRQTFFDVSYGREVLPKVFQGLLLNIRLTIVATLCIAVLAMALALVRTSTTPALAPLRILATDFVDLFRGVPTLLVILLVGFGVPALGMAGVTSSVVVLGTTAVVLTYSAYVAEVLRSGILSVHPSQVAAARSLGLTAGQALRHVVLPQLAPYVAAAARSGLSLVWKIVLIVELLGRPNGVGFEIGVAFQLFDVTRILAYALAFVAVILVIETLLVQPFERRASRWRVRPA